MATAGHCISSGTGQFATNVLFCPSYRDTANASRGCWPSVSLTTSTRWHTLGDPDFDYGGIVTRITGTVVANKIGNVTGWLGRAWNWSAAQAERTFGYPQAYPFTGPRLVTTASTEWYTHDFTAGLQVSKVIGSDLTGGSSGGPWILGWANIGSERPDSDGRSATDPDTNWINGVNSHKRCLVECRTPSIATAGGVPAGDDLASVPEHRGNGRFAFSGAFQLGRCVARIASGDPRSRCPQSPGTVTTGSGSGGEPT